MTKSFDQIEDYPNGLAHLREWLDILATGKLSGRETKRALTECRNIVDRLSCEAKAILPDALTQRTARRNAGKAAANFKREGKASEILRLAAQLKAEGLTPRSINATIAERLEIKPQYVGRVRRKYSPQK